MSDYEDEEFMFNPSLLNEEYDDKNEDTFGSGSLKGFIFLN
jgi:hypothetical protein